MKSTSSAFVHPLVIGLVMTFTVVGSTGLGTVWLRHQISATANTNRALAAELTRIERLIDEKKTLIETEQAPDKLRALNASMRLGLVPMNEVHIEQVTENTVDRLGQRGLRGFLDTDRGPTAPPMVSFRIASR